MSHAQSLTGTLQSFAQYKTICLSSFMKLGPGYSLMYQYLLSTLLGPGFSLMYQYLLSTLLVLATLSCISICCQLYRDYYYQHVVWVDTNQVAVVWLNRPQNISILTLCQVKTGECTIKHDLRTPDGWVVDVSNGFQESSLPQVVKGLSHLTNPWKEKLRQILVLNIAPSALANAMAGVLRLIILFKRVIFMFAFIRTLNFFYRLRTKTSFK